MNLYQEKLYTKALFNYVSIRFSILFISINNHSDFYNIESFIEKPNKKNAEKYLKSGNYLWNTGMFMFKASKYLNEFS
mgnify:CR=1 FL=1